ncbi:hypothetical protein CTAYLR_001771 [Chrysophaeum taylorii]|uniref:Uncharacterized protein n=1 Tax=Chrysophaeum taylorii TaxID=2483200 RepID=A0AAD7UEX8_9STRA|nr:hypothetical protein CTAYLR_001771 [Chrysophaeum taylorii]
MFESICDQDCLTNDGRPRGRNFLFGGRSSLCEPRVWDVCEVEVQNDIGIEESVIKRNNLGGNGPRNDTEEVIQFGGIVTDSPDSENHPVDLVVSATEGAESYQVANASYNGRWHDVTKVNVRDGTRAFLDFSFVDSVAGDAVELEKFVFTVYDIDQQTDPSVQRESVCIDDEEYHEAGFLCDNPTNSRLDIVTCDECQQCRDDEERFSQYFPIDRSDRAALIAFVGPQTKFSIMLEVECENCNEQTTGRNFVFGGFSTLCDHPAKRTIAPASQPVPTLADLALKRTTAFVDRDGTELDLDAPGTLLIVGDELTLSYVFESMVALEVETTTYLLVVRGNADRVPKLGADHHPGTVCLTNNFTRTEDDLDESHGTPDGFTFARTDELAESYVRAATKSGTDSRANDFSGRDSTVPFLFFAVFDAGCDGLFVCLRSADRRWTFFWAGITIISVRTVSSLGALTNVVVLLYTVATLLEGGDGAFKERNINFNDTEVEVQSIDLKVLGVDEDETVEPLDLDLLETKEALFSRHPEGDIDHFQTLGGVAEFTRRGDELPQRDCGSEAEDVALEVEENTTSTEGVDAVFPSIGEQHSTLRSQQASDIFTTLLSSPLVPMSAVDESPIRADIDGDAIVSLLVDEHQTPHPLQRQP